METETPKNSEILNDYPETIIPIPIIPRQPDIIYDGLLVICMFMGTFSLGLAFGIALCSH